MKELYDPVYYPPSIQGFNNDYHSQLQRQQQYQQRQHIQRQQSSSSSSSSKASTVLGRFLKLGKSKSDASSINISSATTGRASNNGGGHYSQSGGGGSSSSTTLDPEAQEVDEFRLSPSVRVARGPVEKMVHKANSRKDVSRSHSWIYGSVKLPSDLPFGYADAFNFSENSDEHEVMTMTMEQVEQQHHQRSQSGGGHYLHTHAVQAMQIPRCQLDYYCTCDCGGGGGDEIDMVMMSSSGRPIVGAGGSVRGGRRGGRGSANGPCQACAREMAMKYALPSSSKSHRKSGSGSGGGDSESFVSSVRKLTWKSLKQVVKKRPSIDTLKKMPQSQQSAAQIHPEYMPAPIVPMPFLSPGALSGSEHHLSKNPLANNNKNNSHYGNPRLNGAVVSHNGAIHSSPNHPMMIASPQSSSSSSGITMSPNGSGAPIPSPANELSEQQQQGGGPPNYFFPEKKGFYASCNDIYGDEPPPHVTASVRVRPKRTRQPYEFPSEFGPVPNYEEEAQQLYHSEWDLRQVMSYDVWMSTTSHVKARPDSGPQQGPAAAPALAGPGSSSKSSSGRTSQQSRGYHSNSSGNLHVPPPDYPPPEPLTNTNSTFRPQSRSSSSCAAGEKIIISSSTSGGSVKNLPGSSSRSSRASLASLQSSHSSSKSSSGSSSSKSTAKNSQSGSISSTDTLTISSTFANNNNPKSSSSNNSIIKRSSILAADVSAYQLLKQQTKKQGKTSSVQQSPSSSSSQVVQVKQQQQQQIIKPAIIVPQQSATDNGLDDAFSESSDDLSDNAITGSVSTPSSSANANANILKGSLPTASADEAAKRGRVRIAGQGIRMAPNNVISNNANNNNRSKNQQKTSITVSSAAPPPPKMKESSSNSNRTSTFSTYQKKSMMMISRKDSSGSEDDVWSDCHTDFPFTTENQKMTTIVMSSPSPSSTSKQQMMMMMDYKNHHNQNQNQNQNQAQHVGSSSTLTKSREQQSKGVSMKVNGENIHHNMNNNTNTTMIVSANMNTSRNHHQELQPATRATFVTFEQQPKQKQQQQLQMHSGKNNSNHPQQQNQDEYHDAMEFEEYEFDQNGGVRERQQVAKTQKQASGNKSSSSTASILKSDSNNVVSLNVPRNPMANQTQTQPPTSSSTSSTSGSTIMQHQHHPTYIKHSKGQQSNSSGTGKFGALRRRKSRNGPNNPGKLLQETIYEEDVEQIDDFNGSHNQNQSSGGHSVKIMVSTGSSSSKGVNVPPPPVASQSVKPILKNRERTYETPVINNGNNSSAGANGNTTSADGGSSCNIIKQSSDNFTGSSSFDSQINNNSSSNNSNDIYFESSVSTVSTASKKKVQFDPSKLVVCGGNSEEEDDCSEEYDDEDDDSDQWSAKSDEEHEEQDEEQQQSRNQTQNQQRKAAAPACPSGNDYRTGLALGFDHDISSSIIDNGPGANTNGNPNQSLSDELALVLASKAAAAKARTSFEEEVARKAALFAKSREAAAAAKAKAAAEEEERNKKESSNSNSNHNHHAGDGDDVNNLLVLRQQKQTAPASRNDGGGCRTTENNQQQQQQNQVVVIPRISTVNVSRNNNNINGNINNGSASKPAKDSQPLMNKRSSTNNRENSQRSNDRNEDSGSTSIQWDTDAEIFKNGTNNRVLNPNSLLFNDTTRIRLNQSRPALQENTFNSSSNGGGSTGHSGKGGVAGRITRLKQSNSFRSVSSMPLRPKEPPPPPPQSNSFKPSSSLASVVPSRLQKALSTSTLLSKSTEKLHQLSSTKSNGNVSQSQSHYGPGGRLLPSKSQISLPLDFTTTSNQATKAVGIAGSVETLNLSSNSNTNSKSSFYQKQNNSSSASHKTAQSQSTKPSKYIRASASSSSSSSSSRSLANRSKSLTDKCEALEKVLSSTKRNPRQQTSTLSLSRDDLSEPENHQPSFLKSAASLPHLAPPLPPQDMDSKSIEIVTKENDVSEIRIYSSSSALFPTDENLPYQGIIYESTKTLITTTSSDDSKPLSHPHPEIHYAATDLFPSSAPAAAAAGVPLPKSSPPPALPTKSVALKTPKVLKQEEIETSGKSVVLIIDNSKNNSKNTGKGGLASDTKSSARKSSESPLTYSQPIDTISKSSGGGIRALPQIPVENLKQQQKQQAPKAEQIYGGNEEDEEPLYDDVINHVDPALPPPPPPSNKTQKAEQLRVGGSLGRKSIGSLITNSTSNSNSSTKGKEYKCLPPHQLGELPPLPPPPVPPHRTLPISTSSSSSPPSSGILSSTLPCLACPPSLPPPNLPSKNLSEFHNRPLVIQESEEDYMEESNVINGFPEASTFRSTSNVVDRVPDEDLEQEVDNLYNDIGTPTLSSPGLVIGQHHISSSASSGSTMKSSTAAAFASAMKEAFLGAIKSMDFDKRSVHSSSSSSGGSGSISQKQNQQQNHVESSELIYDDTALINHSKMTNEMMSKNMQHAPLPHPPPPPSNKSSSSSSSCQTLSKNSVVAKQHQQQQQQEQNQDDHDDAGEEEECNEPLYDDVLNITQLEKSKEILSSQGQTQNQVNGEYLSSNSSDSGTEDLPPPLPAQGPPPLSKIATDFHFPVLPSIPLAATVNNNTSTTSKSNEIPSENEQDSSSDKDVLDRTRSLLNELNEKLSKLNFTPPEQTSSGSGSSASSSASPGASSFSSTSSGGGEITMSSSGKNELSHLAPGDFSTYISKVVISPSSESSGVEEDYNSEKNYSLSNGSDAASSSDENYKMSQVSKLVTETITLARGKFLENMKLSMLGGGNGNNSNNCNNNNNNNQEGNNGGGGPGLLMMSSEMKGKADDCSTIKSSSSSSSSNNNRNNNCGGNNSIEEEEDEPIYEEIGDNHQKQERQQQQQNHSNNVAISEEEEDDRSGSPVYADAFDAKSMFDGASRSEILSFLESIRDRLTGAESTSSSESQSSSISSKKDGKFLDIVERNDSGIGSESGSLVKSGLELSKLILPASSSSPSSGSERSSSPPEMQIKGEGGEEGSPCPSLKQLCSDCNDVDLCLEEQGSNDPTVNTGVAQPHLLHHQHHHHLSSSVEDMAGVGSGSNSHSGRGVCRSCNRKRNEKKEIIMEIYETELKYGRDLRIISEEFYKPIQIAGLLAKEQLDQIFLNVDELIQINLELTSRLKMAIHKSTNTPPAATEMNKQGQTSKTDEDLSGVNVGKIFLQLGESMMTAFENYCTRQASAGALLSQLEKEKELLRIFLRVSQMENTVLRRMNLPAFLMVPVQRVTRYPLLLCRLVKVTPLDHFSRDELQLAQEKIEQHLEHMNKTTREVASVKLWRRISIINGNSNSSNNSAPVHRRSNSDLDTSNIRIRKMAMDVMDWSNFNDVSCVIDNQLGSVHFNGKAMRNIYGCLLARGKDLDLLASKMDQDLFFPPAEDVVKDVKLVLVRVKNTRFCLLREPLCLSKCVVSQGENEFQDFIEINEITTKNTYFIQGLDKQSTGTWLKFLQCYSSCVGHWRRRRPALANIMMNGMIKHL